MPGNSPVQGGPMSNNQPSKSADRNSHEQEKRARSHEVCNDVGGQINNNEGRNCWPDLVLRARHYALAL